MEITCEIKRDNLYLQHETTKTIKKDEEQKI